MNSHSILVAGHDQALSELVRKTLAGNGYNITLEASSQGAITCASLTPPALLVISAEMPQLSGIEAARQIQQTTHCKVLLLSPLASDPDFVEVLAGLRQQGCRCSALPVPFTSQQLLAGVRTELGLPPGPQEKPAVMPAAAAELPADDALLANMRPQLYAINAFRITNLNVDASLQEIARRGEELAIAETLGIHHSTADVFALGPPSAAQTRAALQSLKMPEQRLIQEFFWFWPLASDGRTDEALQALHRGDIPLAENAWKAANAGQGELECVHVLLNTHCSPAEQAMLLAMELRFQGAKAISIHNLAVLNHLYALRLSSGQSTERLAQWQTAFAFWSQLHEHHSFWQVLADRIRTFNDPRLNVSAAHMLWQSLPLALLSVNAECAAMAVEAQSLEAATEQRQIMMASPFAADCVQQALHTRLKPVSEELARLSKMAEAESRQKPGGSLLVAREFFAATAHSLQGIDCLLDAGDPMRDAAHDLIAKAGRSCLLDYVNQSRAWRVAQPYFQQCFDLAASNSLRARLKQDLDQIARNLAEPPVLAQAAAPKLAPSLAANPPAQPRSGYTASSRAAAFAVYLGILIALCVLPGILPGGSSAATPQSHEPIQTQAGSTPPAPASTVPPALSPASSLDSSPTLSAASSPDSSAHPAASAVDLSGLSRAIKHDTMRLNGMSPGLAEMKARIDALQAAMGTDEAGLQSMQKQGNFDQSDAGAYETTHKRLNASLATYNNLANEYEVMEQRYRSLAQSIEAQQTIYNNLARAR